MVILWTVLFAGIGLGLLGGGKRSLLHRRHDRLLQSWADLYQRNQAAYGHSETVDLAKFPGVQECWEDIRALDRRLTVLMAVTTGAGMLLSLMITLSPS